MRNSMIALAALMPLLAGGASAATYSYTGQALQYVHNHSACTIGPCIDYAPTDRVIGSFSTASPLPPNQMGLDLSSLLTSYSLSDGHVTVASSDGQARIYSFAADTDASGNPINTYIIVQRWRTATPLAAPGADERIDVIQQSFFGDIAEANGTCGALRAGPAATSPSDTCDGNPSPTADSSAAQPTSMPPGPGPAATRQRVCRPSADVRPCSCSPCWAS